MIIKLTKAQYDTSKPDDHKRLLNYIPHLKRSGKDDVIDHIKQQIESATAIGDTEKTIYKKAGGDITALAKPTAAFLTTPLNPFEDGETEFQELYHYLLEDMSRYSGNITALITYTSLVANMFIHMATVTPVDCHGKAQHREFKNKTQLQYFRSQGEHPTARLFRELIKNSDDTKPVKSRLPLNRGFIKLITSPELPTKLCSKIKKMDPDTGLPKKGKEKEVDSYIITKIAHAGARRNNLSTLQTGMQLAITHKKDHEQKDALKNKLSSILKPTKKIIALSEEELSARTQELLKHFKKISKKLESETPLHGELLNYRINRITALHKKTTSLKLKHLSLISSQQNVTCLFIRLYPNCTKVNDTYKEGVTNILLSFFGALLNHHLQKAGLHLRAERRQSFGFLRPTLTDAGNLTIRVSLGLEPTSFDDIILQSLKDFDAALEAFNFEHPTHETVNDVLALMPKKAKKEQEKTEGKARKEREGDTYILNSVRKDDRTLTAFYQAEAHLNKAETKDGKSYIKKAMGNFLTTYVKAQERITVTKNPNKTQSAIIQPIPSPLVNLLKNTLNYAVNFASQLELLAKNKPLQNFGHCFYHSLLKLYLNCTAAEQLLNAIEKTEASAFYQKATTLIETLLEYLISLDGLVHAKTDITKPKDDPIEKLRHTEIINCATMLGIREQQCSLYFTDSGQQAIVTTLLTMPLILSEQARDKKTYDNELYLFDSAYYEIPEFLHDIKNEGAIKETKNKANARIVFSDISRLDQFPENEFPNMDVLIIDMTNNPYLNQERLQKLIKKMQEHHVWVVLAESALKHEQLGLDKYQSGRIIALSPSFGEKLPREVDDLLKGVSEEAMNPRIAAYLQMVNDICHKEKALPPKQQASQKNIFVDNPQKNDTPSTARHRKNMRS